MIANHLSDGCCAPACEYVGRVKLLEGLYTCVALLFFCMYHSVSGKRPLPGKRSCTCTSFQGINVVASIQVSTHAGSNCVYV